MLEAYFLIDFFRGRAEMRKQVNIPIWYTDEYESKMDFFLKEIPLGFTSENPLDFEYLNCLLSRAKPWDLDLHKVLTENIELRWDGDDITIGYNAIRIQNAYVLRHILPSYLMHSIEVWDRGKSLAEDTMMPELLAERLCMSGWKIEQFIVQFNRYTMWEMRLIRGVLDLISLRDDETATYAHEAIESFWHRFPAP